MSDEFGPLPSTMPEGALDVVVVDRKVLACFRKLGAERGLTDSAMLSYAMEKFLAENGYDPRTGEKVR